LGDICVKDELGRLDLREQLETGAGSQMLLINSKGNTSPDEFRCVVWEGGIPVPEEYKM
jgi:hypothetical protein